MWNRRTFLRTMTTTVGVAPWTLATFGRPTGAVAADIRVLPAAAADSLVDFIGVAAHVNWGHTVWDQTTWRPLLGELGVRYVRGKLASARARDHVRALNEAYGTKACALVQSIDDDGAFRFDDTLEMLSFLRDEIGTDKISAIEGPNEYTSKHKSGDWASRLRDYQAFLYESVRGDAAFAGAPVIAPSVWKRSIEEYRALADLAASADFGNLHLYGGGRKPSVFKRDERDEPIDAAIDDAQIASRGKQICVTETGFQVANAVPTPFALPADIAAKYVLRIVAELFLRRDRVHAMSIYALIDDRSGHRYGLLDLDLRPRPAFVALRNLIRLVADRGADFAPGGLVCDVVTSDPQMRSLCLQKRDGRFFLLLWQDAESYDRRTRRAVAVAPRPITLDFADNSVESVRAFRPILSEKPVQQSKRVTTVQCEVPDDLLVVEIVS